MSSTEQRLDDHLAQQDQIDEFAFCLGCGEKVYLHDHATYQGVGDDVLCGQCSVDDAAIDAGQMSLDEWINNQAQNGLSPIEEVEATLRGFTARAIERAAVANGISRDAVRLVLEL